jgi:hypothetical protein
VRAHEAQPVLADRREALALDAATKGLLGQAGELGGFCDGELGLHTGHDSSIAASDAPA